MMSSLFVLLASVLSAGFQARGQQAPPATDVFLAPLTISNGAITVGKPENISQSAGYDNQPFFTPDGRSLLFTSDRASSANGPNSADAKEPKPTTAAQMEIFRYDLGSRQIRRVTATQESEYSPTVTPDGRHISVIRVEADGTQRLWKFTMDGATPSLVLADVKPVGYHAWLDDKRVVMFVLGQPATLQIADVSSGIPEIVTKDIGQSIQKIPGGGVSFIQQSGEGAERSLMVTRVAIENGKAVTHPLIAAVAGARQAHVAWAPDGTLLMAHEGTLYAWKSGQTEWRRVADLASLGLRNVTRLAISPKADYIALVAAQ